jgi:hypothetical protein
MKKYAFGIGALVLAIGLSSYTLAPKDLQLYDFMGTSTTEYGDLSKYVADNNGPDCGTSGSFRCEVYAEPISSGPDAGKPDLTQPYEERKRD